MKLLGGFAKLKNNPKKICGVLTLLIAAKFLRDIQYFAADWIRLGLKLNDFNIEQQHYLFTGAIIAAVWTIGLIITSYWLIRSSNIVRTPHNL